MTYDIIERLSNVLLHDMVELKDIPPDLFERLGENLKREEVEKQHNHTIWKDAAGRWHTYIDTSNSKRGIRHISRSSRKDILDELIEYYRVRDDTVLNTYNNWIQFKREYERIKEQSLTRYDNDYKRFFDGTDFEKLPIENVTENQIRKFIIQSIKDKNLTSKSFAGLRLLLNGIFKYAKYEGKTTISISTFFADLDVHGMFQSPPKKTEAYSEIEIKKIIKECQKKGDAIALTIALDMQTGARIGETTACRWVDVSFKHCTLSISSTAISYKDPVTKKRVHKIQDVPKSEAGDRVIFLTDAAVKTLKKLYLITGQNEFICSDPEDGHRIESNTLRKRLEKICEKIDVKYRGTHAARRTMGTKLLNSGMPDDFVRKQMGHSDIETTRKYYNRDRTDSKTARKQLNEIINY